LEVLGLVILAPATLVYLWCLALFLRGRGTPLPFAPPREFVVQGPYCYSRNPMALSVICGAVGVSLFLSSAPGLVFSGGLAFILHLYIRHREEPELVRRFGDSYVAYRRRVPRWVPGTKPTHVSNREHG
jgi:protein-S-isoprenylcysteine O-methyltransferase Ste14